RSLGPPGDDSLDQLIGRPANTRGHLVACNTAKRIDLFADRARYGRPCNVDARTDLLACEVRGVDEKPDRGPRARMRVADAFRDGQKGLLPGARLPDHPGGEGPRGRVRLGCADANLR